MNFKELFEGVEPSMPGAPRGIQIMTPQQFVAKSGDMPDETEAEQEEAEAETQVEGEDHLSRIRKLSGLDEATKLPAQSREFGSDEFQDYMKRIIGTPDLDKAGNVKTDKKGNEKYVSGKTKTD
jgi:hypothetical protein